MKKEVTYTEAAEYILNIPKFTAKNKTGAYDPVSSDFWEIPRRAAR